MPMTPTVITIIQCVCSVATIVISMVTISAKYFKNMATKSDLEPIEEKLDMLEKKMDRQEAAQSDMRERMAVVEYELGIHRRGGST